MLCDAQPSEIDYETPAVSASESLFVPSSEERASSGRYRSASATCVQAIELASSRSAIVRATFSTRWYARADNLHRSAADASSSRASLSTGVLVSSQRPDECALQRARVTPR